MRYLFLLPLALFMAACASGGATVATLSPQQCDADWAAVGQADGQDGARVGKLAGYRSACARGGAPLSEAEEAAWRDGWKSGVETLCAADEADLDVRRANARIGLCGTDLAAATEPTLHVHDDGYRHSHSHTSHHHHHGHYGYHHGPRLFPTIGFGLGVGSYGTRFGSRVGLGLVFPIGGYHHY